MSLAKKRHTNSTSRFAGIETSLRNSDMRTVHGEGALATVFCYRLLPSSRNMLRDIAARPIMDSGLDTKYLSLPCFQTSRMLGFTADALCTMM